MSLRLERESVARGLRAAGLVACKPQDLPQLSAWATARDCVVIPQDVVGASPYRATAAPPQLGERWRYRVLLARQDALPLRGVNLRTDDGLGTRLGYPGCCRAFFARTWGAGQVDTTWDQYMHTPRGGPEFPTTGYADGPVEANLLWRWLGPRWVFHLPCSYACDETVAIGRRYRELALMLGFAEEVRALDEILSWPVQWSAVNGIGVIVGPCVRISTRTDWSQEARQFHRQGRYRPPEPWLWRDNGFADPAAMRAAHDPIVRALADHAPPSARICDLGCGNGLLLRRTKMRRPDVTISGVDINETAIAHARQSLVGQWTVADFRTAPWPGMPTVVMLTANWIAELAPEARATLRAALSTVERIVVYAYGDNLAAGGSLHDICISAGLPHPAIIAQSPDVAIGMYEGQEL